MTQFSFDNATNGHRLTQMTYFFVFVRGQIFKLRHYQTFNRD
jgi:hypothetical protein